MPTIYAAGRSAGMDALFKNSSTDKAISFLSEEGAQYKRREMSASLAPECNEVKEKYDSCFLKWYSEKFLRGNSSTNECEPLFKQYKQCLNVALKERGIDTMLDEARESYKDADSDHLKKS